MSRQPLMHIRIYFEPKYLVNASALMMIIVILIASLIPSWRRVRLKPVEVMR